MHPGKSRGEGKAELFAAKKLPGGQPDDGARAGGFPGDPLHLPPDSRPGLRRSAEQSTPPGCVPPVAAVTAPPAPPHDAN